MKKPDLYVDKKKCCACFACFSVCPQDAIDMESDDKGFRYPVIKDEKCIGCMMCTKVCPLR